LLTVRGFSSAVYVAATLALLWPLAMVAALHGYLAPPSTYTVASWLDATWLPHVMVIKAACVLEICALAALTPVLIAHQLPRFWLERAIGTTGQELWEAKLWYTRLITLPGAALVCTMGVLTFSAPAYYVVPLIAECLWLWWMISSVTGALAFEIPTRPGLALVFSITVGLAIGAIAALAWPAGLLTHGQAMHSLSKRGSWRARYFMITEAE
jgi:hypothetical protein